MTQIGFYLDMKRCAGCKTCQVACKEANSLDRDVVLRVVDTYQTGTYPNVGMYHFSHACNHCAEPLCVANCPTGAMQKDPEDGTVFNDHDVCIGCGSCAQACPYGAPFIDEATHLSWKCDACRDIRAAGGKPVCVEACPFRALDFGELGELEAKYGSGGAVRALPCFPDGGTGASTLVLASGKALEDLGEPVVL